MTDVDEEDLKEEQDPCVRTTSAEYRALEKLRRTKVTTSSLFKHT